MLDQLREHGSEILSRADAGPVARTRCGQSSFTIVSPGKTACKSRFWPFSIQIVLASTMHYHADLEWVRTAFRNFSRTVVNRIVHLAFEVVAPESASVKQSVNNVAVWRKYQTVRLAERVRNDRGHGTARDVHPINLAAGNVCGIENCVLPH